MNIEIASQPAYSIAYVRLDQAEEVICETGAMVALSAGVEMTGSTGGGIAKAAVRKIAGQESFFRSSYVSRVPGGWVALAPKFPGDIGVLDVDASSPWIVQTGAILGHGAGVETSVKFGGLGSVVQREGLMVLQASGNGKMIICSYGGLQRFTPGPGERIIVDTGHLVAWTASMGVRIGPLSGLVSSVVSGEGLVAELTGPGEVWIQTRAEAQLRSWLVSDREQNTRQQ